MDEVLFAYIAIASHAVSLVLIWVDNGVQRQVYYVSKSLHKVKIHYLPLEKAILAMVHAPPLLPITHSYCLNLAPAQISTSERRLHRESCKVEYDPKGF